MADKSPVHEGQCSERRKELFDKMNAIEKEVDQMQGERRFVRYIMPLLVVVILAVGGQYFKLSVRETIRKELKENRRVEETTKFSIDEKETEPLETFEFKMLEAPTLVPATAE